MKFISLVIALSIGARCNSSHAENLPSHQYVQSFFVENRGQITDQHGCARNDVKFIFSSPNFKMILRENGWSYEFVKKEKFKDGSVSGIPGEVCDGEYNPDDNIRFQSNRVDVKLLNANLHPAIIAENLSAGVLNFYAPQNPENGVTGVHSFKKILYKNIYPDIDLEFQIRDEDQRFPSVEYSFIIHPGGNPDIIQLSFEGNASVVMKENSIHIESSLGKVAESSPVYFTQGSNEMVRGSFLKKGNTISFGPVASLAGWAGSDHNGFTGEKTFIIDPTITYCTYYGGDTTDYAEDMELDSEGNIIVIGRTASHSNIATSGAYDNTYSGGNFDAFLLKFNSFFQLQWATYFGGVKVDYGWAVTLDPENNIYLGGEAYSDSLATPGAEQKTIEGTESDGFVAKFRSEGTLVWCRYFGGNEKDQVLAITIDNTGRLIITGFTLSADSIATTGSYNSSYGGNGDIFLAALDTTLGTTIWSTYYGAEKNDRSHHVIIDAFNNIYLSGTALSTTGIATPGTQQPTLGGIFDAYLAKFSPDGIPVWGTYVGGTYEDRGRDCVIDHDGYIYITGFSQSDSGIATEGTWKQFRSQGIDSTGYNTLDAFLLKFDTNGQRVWGTYFGDSLSETTRGIAVNPNNDILITGVTYSPEGIVYGNAYQTSLEGISDAYFAKFNSDGSLVYSSYFGGSDEEQVGGYGLIIRVDSESNVYLCSSTLSSDSIATPGAYQTALAGGYDVFIAKFADTTIAVGETVPVEATNDDGLLVYPNPAHDFFFVNVRADEKSPAFITVYSSEGRLMVQRNVTLLQGKNEFQLPATDFKGGLYVVAVIDNNTFLMKKFLVE